MLIVGAGPAGLAVAACLRKEGIDFDIVEASDKVGNAWHQHYDRLHLHTVKELSHLPHLPFPQDYPRYVSRLQLLDYFDEYQRAFQIQVQTDTPVSKIEKEGKQWLVKTAKEDLLVKHLVICTGVNRVPNKPNWPGLDSFKGRLLHSSKFRNSKPYKDQSILVVGMGNTGAELAMDLSEVAHETYLSVRSPVSVVPRDLNGRPVQLTARKLAKLPWGLGDWIGSRIRQIYFGNLEQYGLSISKLSPLQQLRTTGKTPIVDIGTIAAIKKGNIRIRSGIERFTEETVFFEDGKSEQIDTVILATGFKARLFDFFPESAPFLDANALPKSAIGTEIMKDCYFVGFDNYKLGGILGTIQCEAPKVASVIAQKVHAGC